MEVTTSTAPWWYVAALAGGFTVLGGCIGLLSTFMSDGRKFAHEESRRYDDELRGFAAKFISHLVAARDQLKLLRLADEEAVRSGRVDGAGADRSGPQQELETSLRDARMVLDELSIIAPIEVRDAARQFYLFVNHLKKDGSSDLWDSRFWVLLHDVIGTTRLAVGLPAVERFSGWISG
jgi:hypothetical protein